MRYHSLLHVSFETPGLLADVIHARGHALATTGLYAGDNLPALGDFDVLIVMGGPMSIHDESEYPWLRPEKELIAAAIGEGKKVLGVCLGAQLIAAVCGARVYPNPVKEIGWFPVRWIPTGRETPYFHWHGETFDLPKGAELLASTGLCENQAFRVGDRVMGVQFHPEVTPEMIGKMIDNEGWELAVPAPSVRPAIQILEETAALAAGGRGKLEDPEISFLTDWL